MEGAPSWGSVPDLSRVQQQLKTIKCFLLGENLAILTLFFFSLAGSLQFRHYSCKHIESLQIFEALKMQLGFRYW